MTFLETELLNALRHLEAHYQERERVQERNLRILREQVENLAKHVDALTRYLSALEQRARPLPPASSPG
jgi:hypothetical protein